MITYVKHTLCPLESVRDTAADRALESLQGTVAHIESHREPAGYCWIMHETTAYIQATGIVLGTNRKEKQLCVTEELVVLLFHEQNTAIHAIVHWQMHSIGWENCVCDRFVSFLLFYPATWAATHHLRRIDSQFLNGYIFKWYYKLSFMLRNYGILVNNTLTRDKIGFPIIIFVYSNGRIFKWFASLQNQMPAL